MKERNQAEEIYNYLLAHEPVSAYDIVEGTGWHEYVVEKTLKIMLESDLIEQVGTNAHGLPLYGYKRRYGALLTEIERLEHERSSQPPPPAKVSPPPARHIPPEKILTDEEVQACAEAAINAGLALNSLPPVEALMGLVTSDRQSIDRVYVAIWQQREHLPW